MAEQTPQRGQTELRPIPLRVTLLLGTMGLYSDIPSKRISALPLYAMTRDDSHGNAILRPGDDLSVVEKDGSCDYFADWLIMRTHPQHALSETVLKTGELLVTAGLSGLQIQAGRLAILHDTRQPTDPNQSWPRMLKVTNRIHLITAVDRLPDTITGEDFR